MMVMCTSCSSLFPVDEETAIRLPGMPEGAALECESCARKATHAATIEEMQKEAIVLQDRLDRAVDVIRVARDLIALWNGPREGGEYETSMTLIEARLRTSVLTYAEDGVARTAEAFGGDPDWCDACDEGCFIPIAKPGRTFPGRGGALFEVPADLVIPTCEACGEQLLDGYILEALGVAEAAAAAAAGQHPPCGTGIQWAAERVADKVAALAATTPEDHLPPRNDAEAEEKESRADALDGLRYGPSSLLYFDILTPQSFSCQIDGEGDIFYVFFSENFRRAGVIQSNKDGYLKGVFCEGEHEVAEAILGIR